MSTFSINIQEPYLSYVLRGQKIVEGRLNKGKFASINAGDFIEIEPGKEIFEVIYKNKYGSFKEMIEKEGLKKVIPDVDSIDKAVSIYYKFYTKKQEKEFGVVAVGIKRKSEVVS